MRVPRIVIAGTHSGAGKTTVTLGLLRALQRRGMVVQPFKVGPDFIDPEWQTAAVTAAEQPGRLARNLDAWLLPPATVVELFARDADGADVAVIEGMMGLYDGVDGRSEAGSTAEVAKLLRAPVVLVLDVAGSVRSAAAVALGFVSFDPEVTLAGVIANRVGGGRHEQWLHDALDTAGVPLLGVLPWDDRLKLPERHLGLVPAAEHSAREAIDALADAVEEHVDVAALVRTAGLALPLVVPGPQIFPPMSVAQQVALGVARDEAFSFYYEDALDLLESRGARIVPFSPLHDHDLPPVHGLYMGGGFPEIYARKLAENVRVREQVKEAVASGMPVYAECGGMMYLAQTLVDEAGREHPMVGALPLMTRMQPRLAALGYVTLTATTDSVLLRKGETVRGHEFHFSTTTPLGPVEFGLTSVGGRGLAEGKDGICTPNVFASYAHVHFASHPVMAERFVNAAKNYRGQIQGSGTEVKQSAR
ncbi:MAG TPA: cobyrinate a,c-diamide synthase [bacterium]